MQGRKVFSLFNKYLVVICLFAPVMLTLTTPATAEDDEYKGWFGVLDLALTQPNSLDQHFARSFDLSGPILQSDRSVVDNDDDSTFRVGIGYSWGRLGNLKVSYWEFDNNDSQIANLSGYIYPTVSGFVQDVLTANYAYLYNYPAMPAKATSNVEARTLDLDYVRPIAIGENFTLKWLAGLRVADYEEDQAVDGDSVYYGYFTYPVTFQETKHIESKAFGFRVGATGVFHFTEHFSLEAGMGLSFMQADTDGESSATLDLLGPTPFARSNVSDDNIRGQIQEYDFKALWSFGPVDWYLGYSFSDWEGLVSDPLPREGTRGRDNISFNSIYAGIIWRVGGT